MYPEQERASDKEESVLPNQNLFSTSLMYVRPCYLFLLSHHSLILTLIHLLRLHSLKMILQCLNHMRSPSFTQHDTFMTEPYKTNAYIHVIAFSHPVFTLNITHPAQTNSDAREQPKVVWEKVHKGKYKFSCLFVLDEHVAVQRENKVRTLLLQALPEDHMPDFHHYDDARDIWMAVKARFGGNEESKKMKKTMLKQQFAEFSVTEEEGLHKGMTGFKRFWSVKSEVQSGPDNDDASTEVSKRAVHSSVVASAMALRKNKSYGVKVAAAPTHSAFIGTTSSGSKPTYSDQQRIVPSVSQTSGRSDNLMECVLHSFVAENEQDQDMIY
ncbi:hypothetical protein Tco_0039018 [Tanacetum coccineum]